MLPAPYRFHGHNSLRFVYAHGKAVRSQALTLKWTTNPRRKKSRVAVVVSKKVLKSAVGRNRIRRRVYEYMRTRLPDLNAVYDIVWIVTSAEVRTMPAPELAQILDGLTEKADILTPR